MLERLAASQSLLTGRRNGPNQGLPRLIQGSPKHCQAILEFPNPLNSFLFFSLFFSLFFFLEG